MMRMVPSAMKWRHYCGRQCICTPSLLIVAPNQ